MSKFKDFGAPAAAENAEPIIFKLHNEDFVCVPELQGRVLLDFVSKANDTDPVTQAKVISDFFKYVLNFESLERFDVLTTSKDKIVSVDVLAEILAWVVEQYTDRPEEQPEDSQAGQ